MKTETSPAPWFERYAEFDGHTIVLINTEKGGEYHHNNWLYPNKFYVQIGVLPLQACPNCPYIHKSSFAPHTLFETDNWDEALESFSKAEVELIDGSLLEGI